jgi:hypothetical protein
MSETLTSTPTRIETQTRTAAPAAMPSGLPRGVSERSRRGWGPAAGGRKLAWLFLVSLLVVRATAAENARQIVEDVQ